MQSDCRVYFLNVSNPLEVFVCCTDSSGSAADKDDNGASIHHLMFCMKNLMGYCRVFQASFLHTRANALETTVCCNDF